MKKDDFTNEFEDAFGPVSFFESESKFLAKCFIFGALIIGSIAFFILHV